MTQVMQPQKAPERASSVAIPLPSVRLYMVWGSVKIRSLVRYHHNLLRLSGAEEFFPCEEEAFEAVTRKTADYFVEILSKGKFSPASHGFASVAVHRLYRDFDESKREIWLEMYKKAIKEMHMPSECIEDFWNWIEPLSVLMLKRNSQRQIRRYPYTSVWTDFVEFTQRHRCDRF